MSAADLAARLEAARRFTVPLAEGAVLVTLRCPTEHESSCLYLEAGAPAASQWMRWQRLLVERAVVGWQGITEAAFEPGGPGVAESVPVGTVDPDHAAPVWPPVAFDAALVPLLLDARPDWARALIGALLGRLAEARASREAAAGN
jgi:hypothetical protein